MTTRENVDVPITTTPTRVCPGMLGGVEWNGPSFNARTNMLYVPAVDWCSTLTAFAEPRYIPGKSYFGGTFDFDPPEKAHGWITAVDATTGEVRWKYRSPRPMVAAVTSTAGGLLLAGELTGDFLALDALSGEVLYRFNTGGPMGGGIVTYQVGGRQVHCRGGRQPVQFLGREESRRPDDRRVRSVIGVARGASAPGLRSECRSWSQHMARLAWSPSRLTVAERCMCETVQCPRIDRSPSAPDKKAALFPVRFARQVYRVALAQPLPSPGV